jgi:curved DNA-binding protein CbpA
MAVKDYYLVLGVPRERRATQGIRAVFRSLVNQNHPDRAGPQSASILRDIAEAYRVLSDPEGRRRYNWQLRRREGFHRRSPPARLRSGAPHSKPSRSCRSRCSAARLRAGREPRRRADGPFAGENFYPSECPKAIGSNRWTLRCTCRRPRRRAGPCCRSGCRCFELPGLWRCWARLAVSQALLRRAGHRRGGGRCASAFPLASTTARSSRYRCRACDREPLPASARPHRSSLVAALISVPVGRGEVVLAVEQALLISTACGAV